MKSIKYVLTKFLLNYIIKSHFAGKLKSPNFYPSFVFNYNPTADIYGGAETPWFTETWTNQLTADKQWSKLTYNK